MFKFKTVEYGSIGISVYVLQAMFRGLQYVGKDGKPIDIDGKAGVNTIFAVNTFQKTQYAYGYDCGTDGKVDGKFGAKCWSRLLGV